MVLRETKSFRDLCQTCGIAVTHQRQVLYEVMKTMHGHPTPEQIYASVKQRVPAVSMATVYKNIHLFVENGIFQEVSIHHGCLRLEMNDQSHHHLVCSKCKWITDIGDKELGLGSRPLKLPGGFLVERYAVDVIGICAKCQRINDPPGCLHRARAVSQIGKPQPSAPQRKKHKPVVRESEEKLTGPLVRDR